MKLRVKRGKEVGTKPMNQNPMTEKKPVTLQPTAGGCRMKYVRTFLFLLVAGLMLSGSAWAQGDLSLGGGGNDLSLATITSDAFTDDASLTVELVVCDSSDTIEAVSAVSTDVMAFRFMVLNSTGAQDTLNSIMVFSYNDKENMFKSISLYRSYNNNLTSPTLLKTVTINPVSTPFSENDSLLFANINDTIPNGDTVFYYFEVDIDDANVDLTYDDLKAGLQFHRASLRAAQSGYAPQALTDTLRYTSLMTTEYGIDNDGRALRLDTRPPDFTADYTFPISGHDFFKAGVINLQDSIEIWAQSNVTLDTLEKITTDMRAFGGTASQSDDTQVGDVFRITQRLPETSVTSVPLDVNSGFYSVFVIGEDSVGNTASQEVVFNHLIDNQQPLFDNVSDNGVWVELLWDQNGDGTAAIGDSIVVFSYMTSNSYGEIEAIAVNMINWHTTWGNLAMTDPAGDNRWELRLELIQSNTGLDVNADSTSPCTLWVTAQDNAGNFDFAKDSTTFAVDLVPPDPPVVTYERELDLDSNNVINFYDQVELVVDASLTQDSLFWPCPVELDLYNNGLGGNAEQCATDSTTHGWKIYQYIHTVLPSDMQVNAPAGTHTVDLILYDHAGNSVAVTSPAITQKVDTDPPDGVVNLWATARANCTLELNWTAHPTDGTDDSLYVIFWDGGDGWDVADTTTDTLGTADYPATIWTTDGTVVPVHGTTYQFIVRVIDKGDNREWNTIRVSATADCEPPAICINAPDAAHAFGGFSSPLPIYAQTSDLDIAACSLYVRNKDVGTGTPGDWKFMSMMNRVGGGLQFIFTITNGTMSPLFPGAPAEDLYQAMTVGLDTVGNGQTWDQALVCDTFEFTWFYVGLPASLISVNGAVSPQSGCGFDVTLDTMNIVEIAVSNFTPGNLFTVDVFHTTLGDATQRINYYEDVATMPFTFYMNATNFWKGTNTVWIRVTRDDGNTAAFSFAACAPDTTAPSAGIIFPIDGQRVRKMNSTLRPLNVWARVNNWAYDPSPVTRVEFEHALFSDYMTNGESAFNVFDIQTAPAMGDTFQGNWNNMAFVDGDTVLVRAVFFDNLNNTQATPYITVYLDAFATDIVLTCVQAVDVNGVPTLAGMVDFHAEIQEAFNDFSKLELYVRKTTDPDVFANYTLIGEMGPATDEGTYVWYGYNTAGLTSNIFWDFRVIATDITNNVMWDWDDDGFFDDNTFDPTSSNHHSDKRWFVDNMAAPIAFNQFEANGVTFYTPSTKLGGTGEVYAPKDVDITVWSQTIPMSDSVEVASIRYGWLPANPGTVTWVAQGAADPWYTATFNPYTLGLYTDDDIMNRFTVAWIVVEKLDVLNRPVVTDTIKITILDVNANQAVITSLLWQNYYWGNISLTAGALNAYNMYSVTYEYQIEGESTWDTIATSYDVTGNFPANWQTLGAVPDGWVWVRAVLTDSSFNVDTDPVSTRIFIANERPNATLQSVTLPSNAAVSDSGFIGHNTIFVASASHDNPDIPIDSVLFMYKSVLSGTWHTWSRDYYPPYNAMWSDTITSDGSFHYRVRAYNRAGRFVDSDFWTLYNDETNPTIAATMICEQDVEANNDPALDLNACMPVAELFGEFQDNGSWSGANSGIVKVAFELRNSSGSAMYYQTVDPATDGEQTSSFNISGLPEGTYRFYFYAWDLVGNMTTFGPVNGYITDQTPPVTSVIGYYGNRLYGYDWSGDATEVLFQYQDGDAWIGIGTGAVATGNYWWTEFNASSISGTHNFRLLASDGTNSNEATAILIIGTADGEGGLTFVDGELKDLVVLKNYENDIFEGVLRVTAPSANEPVALAVYQTDFNDPPGFVYEAVDLNPSSPGDSVFQEDVHPDYDVICGGYSIYFVGSADGTGAVMTMIQTFTYWDDLPSTYTGNGGTVTVGLPDGDHSGCMVIMETWLPRSGEPQDDWVPVANHNGGIYVNYIGCGYELDLAPKTDGGDDLTAITSSGCCFGYNRYAQIKMSYDLSIDLPASELAVLKWDPYYGVWESDGIFNLSADAWFDTENHTVQFSSDCLYGIFAVAQQVDPTPGDVVFEVDAYPWCCDDEEVCYTSPVQDGLTPKFTLHITTHEFTEIDDDRFVIKIGGITIHNWETGGDADRWYTHWDAVSGLLDIYMTSDYDDEYEEGGEYSAPPLECGVNTLYIEAKNNQGAWNDTTWTFNVDCTPPVVVFDNYYVGKNPTITFSISDSESGIDWDEVFVDVIAVEKNDTNSARPNQDDNLFFIGTFFPGQVGYYYDDVTGIVTITTHYELADERGIIVAVYDGVRGERSDYYSTGDPVAYGDWDEYYLRDHGIHDCVGNTAHPWDQYLPVDYDGPVILADGETQWSQFDALPNDCPVLISIADDGSGINEVFVYEDDVLISEADGDLGAGEYILDGGYLRYCKTSGVRTRIVATDNVGNSRERTWSAYGPGEATDAGDPYNYPNPFDPSVDGFTTINPGLKGNDAITIKIYDFGGELVKTFNSTDGEVNWYGTTNDGVRVANGIYFAYCTAPDKDPKVVKIAVIGK